ncbi:hypothetical protein Tco_0971109 [Tanacetum coccineum]
MPGCSWRGHLRGVHIHYCPGVLGRDTCEGYTVIIARVFLEGTPVRGTQSLLPGCSWRGHLRGVHIHYCPSVLGGDTCEGYIFITARVFLEGTPVMGTYGFHYCPGVLGGDTYDGYIVHWFHELRVIEPNFEGDPQNDHVWFVSEDDWVIAKWMKRKGYGTQKEGQICYGQFISKLAIKCRVLTEDVVRSLSAPIYCRDLDTTTFRDLTDSDGKLIPKDLQPGVPRVGIPRPPRASMQDLYDRMGRMEIRQDAIERMEYRQSYH